MTLSRFATSAVAVVTSASVAALGMSPAVAAEDTHTGPKNIIYMIGDGMGYGHLALTNLYETGQSKYLVDGDFGDEELKEKDGEPVQSYEEFNRLSMATFPMGGSYDPEQAWKTHEYVTEGKITDSAAAGTAMATGVKTNNGILGMSHYGMKEENMSERAKKQGKSAGVVSSVAYSEATPAAWAAHNMDRDKLQDITKEMLGSDLDLVMAAGHPFYNNDHEKLDTPDYSFIYEDDYAKLSEGQTDWTYFESNDDFQKMAGGDVEPGKKYWGIAQVGSTLQNSRTGEAEAPYSDKLNDVVDLPTMTTGALNALGQDDDGFSVMIEGGAIDWAGHGNNPVRDIEETQDFNKAVDAAIEWVEKNSSWEDTLLIVTADHETGYLSGANEVPTDKNPEADNKFNAMVGAKEEVGRHGWYSGQHTNQLVPFFFKGAGSADIKAHAAGTDPVRGDFIDNTTVANLVFDQWWTEGATASGDESPSEEAPKPSEDEKPSEPSKTPKHDGEASSSTNFGSGVAAGMGILAAVVAALAALAQQTGLVSINPQALVHLAQKVGLR